MAVFNTLTYNCNGLGEKNKRQKIFTFLNEKLSKGFCFLQETHSTSIVEEKWKKEWNGELFYSHGSSNSTGCAIAFSNKFPFKLLKESKDTDGRLLVLEAMIEDEKFLLINLYNANIENNQLKVLDSLSSILDNHNSDGDCKIIFGGDFNLFFDIALDCSGGNPTLKKKSIAKLLKIVDKFDLCDIFRVRYPNLKRFTFHRRNPVIRRRLDYIFCSNSFQEFVGKIEVLPSYLSDHSPVLMTVNFNSNPSRGLYGWKFNNSLLADKKYVSDIRQHFDTIKQDLANHGNPHLKWELFKYEARKFTIAFSKLKVKQANELKIYHENIVNVFENSDNPCNDAEYTESKAFLESFYDNKTQGAILRSKSTYHEQNEKSSKFFLNLENRIGNNNSVKKLVKNNIELTSSKDILIELHSFYSDLFTRKIDKCKNDCKAFLDTLNIPVISDENRQNCDRDLTMEDLEDTLSKMSTGKSPGNDGLTIEFYKFFWDDLKDTLFDSYRYSKAVGELSTSQRQAIIKLIEKRDKDKRFIQNWRPISLLNVDTKILSKSIAHRLIPVLPSIISHDQTAYVKGRYIGESIRLLSDVLELSKSFNIPGFILTIDLEKAFDSVDHTFLYACLEKFGFGKNFLLWVAVLLNNNESCVMNAGHTTKYFSLNRGARQGDPIAAYFFILVLEIFFIMIRSNNNIKSLHILNFNYLLTAYADDATFFIADLNSVRIIFDIFDNFSIFSCMKINRSKCELAGIGVKRNVQTALAGVKNVSLVHDSIRVLGVHFSYDIKVYTDRNFLDCIKKIQSVVKVWNMRFLSIYGKIVIFKTLALSKIVYIGCMSNVPEEIIKFLEQIHKDFIWDKKRPNIKHSTLIADYSKGGLKDIDITSKFKSLHLSWISRLFDDNFHPWKNIPLFYYNTLSSNTSLFNPNLHIPMNLTQNIPEFYKRILKYWCEVSKSEPSTPEMVLSESLFFNSYIRIDNSPITPSFCGVERTIFLKDMFTEDGHLIPWEDASANLSITNYFKWLQVANSVPRSWKVLVRNNPIDVGKCCLDMHLNKSTKIIPFKLLDSRYLYSFFIDNIITVPTSQNYFNNLFGDDLHWDKIYSLPRNLTTNSYYHVFQYKILHNSLYLNSRLFHLKYSNTPLCSLCKTESETLVHFFSECLFTLSLWNDLIVYFRPAIRLGQLTPQSAVLGFFDDDNDLVIRNFILLIFKFLLYKNRSKVINKYVFIQKIKSMYNIEKYLSISNGKEMNKKWRKIEHLFQ